MEEIIKKAIEGGFDEFVLVRGTPYQYLVCNPLFWQALGKACGWNEYRVFGLDMTIEMEQWKYNALRFHEINLTEGWQKAIDYLTSVI